MHIHSRRHRITPAITLTTALVLMLSGCGGSAVQQPTASGPNTGASQAEPIAPPAADGPNTAASQAQSVVPPTGSVPVGQVPAAVTANGAISGQNAGSGNGPQSSGGDAKTNRTTSAGSNTRASTKDNGSTPAATGLTSLVQRQVESQPIFGGSAACKPATGSEVRIGNVSTLSGVLGELFAPVVPALATFVTSQNACGGLNGHPIKFFTADDQGDPSTAAAKVQDMVQRNKVLALVGNIQPLTIDGALPAIRRYGIPVIGLDMVSPAGMTSPLIFPAAGNVQTSSYGFINAAANYFKVKKFGNIYCIEVPAGCNAAAKANEELAPKFGITVVKQVQASITQPSYVSECLQLKNAGAEVVGMNIDGASQIRIARSCTQTQFFPKVVAYPLAVGNEKQFLQGQKWLGNAYIPLNHFPWMSNNTPAEK